ncbi:putative acetyltransferase, partial [Kocuria flava]|uniref:putative acetyltransferase n=1 Tax=Kocuria flava TaxID=446860 RepID=UPI0027D95504
PPGPPSAAGRAALRLLTGLPAGTRVSVRRALPDDVPGLTDALGELVRADEAGVTVRTRRGDVVIAARDLRAARAVPPPPPRRAPRGRPVD